MAHEVEKMAEYRNEVLDCEQYSIKRSQVYIFLTDLLRKKMMESLVVV